MFLVFRWIGIAAVTIAIPDRSILAVNDNSTSPVKSNGNVAHCDEKTVKFTRLGSYPPAAGVFLLSSHMADPPCIDGDVRPYRRKGLLTGNCVQLGNAARAATVIMLNHRNFLKYSALAKEHLGSDSAGGFVKALAFFGCPFLSLYD